MAKKSAKKAVKKSAKKAVKKSAKKAVKKSAKKAVKKSAKKAVKKSAKQELEFPCLRLEQGDYTLAVFTCSAKSLWDILKINKREEDKDIGYQRALSKARAENVAKHIDQNKTLPVSLLITLDEAKWSDQNDSIIVPNRPDAGWVIDGQHRLAGAHLARKDITVPVVAFIGLPESKQVECFVTINREQKGVPSSLYYDLLKHLPESKSETQLTQERASDLASRLKSDEHSPFFRRIVVTTAPRNGELSLTNFVRKVSPLLKRGTGRLESYSDSERQGIINNYYIGLSQVFPHEFESVDSIFFKTLGFGGMMRFLPYFMEVVVNKYSGFRVADVKAGFGLIDSFDFDSWRQLGTGNAAETSAGDEIRMEMESAVNQGNSSTMGIRL